MTLGDTAYKDIYSTSEIKTNETWIDGKPIYRKVFVLKPTNGGEIEFSNKMSYGVAMFDKSHTFLIRSSGSITTGIGADGNSGYWFDARTIATNGNLHFFVGDAIYRGSTIYATVLYTKTTD